MKIYLHIGTEPQAVSALQNVLEAKRDQLAKKNILFARAGGGKNHTRLYMAVSDPTAVDSLRHNRGITTPQKQARLRDNLVQDLQAEIAKSDAQILILSAHQLCTLPSQSALERLRDLLHDLSDDITIIAHIDEQSRALLRHYTETLRHGRTASLAQEVALAGTGNWRENCLHAWQEYDPARHGFPELQAAPHWLDYAGLQAMWEQVFGPGTLRFRAFDPQHFDGDSIMREVRESFDIKHNIGKTDAETFPNAPAAAYQTRMRQVNEILVALLGKGRVIPRQLWRRLMNELAVPGAPIQPTALAGFSQAFTAGNKAVTKAHPDLGPDCLRPDCPQPADTTDAADAADTTDSTDSTWVEAPPEFGFRASQFVAAVLPRIDKATKNETSADTPATPTGLSPVAERLLTPRARENFAELSGGRFAPHNRMGRLNETDLGAPYTPLTKRKLPNENSGKVIVGCMKDEAPYILEWVAYHRAIGVDNFIIYTNACSDGTSELLDHLQKMGVLEHRNNDNWKGNSPQQHALNQSLKEPVIKNAEWVIHIDVDEFINVRCGNGTLDDFLTHVPDATNVAMTWRMFGHNDVTRLRDDLVIDQFDHAAPKYCPKPHTVWGFKTMVKNIGAYEKLSCHRPNKLKNGQRHKVKWVNGSGQEMGHEVKDKGWRSSLQNVGYELLQLNHYALRSAESYLIKRQRGRALHVDRSIGINYWVRMDWSDNPDMTIKRNIPRLLAELEQLRQNDKLVALHEAGVAWHREKAAELHENPEFSDLYAQALATKLTELERVAFALALDLNS